MGDVVPAPSVPMTAAGIAPRLRTALEAADVEQFAALLSPDVKWGPPCSSTPPCRNRRQVLAWYAKGRAQGRRATVSEVEGYGTPCWSASVSTTARSAGRSCGLGRTASTTSGAMTTGRVRN